MYAAVVRHVDEVLNVRESGQPAKPGNFVLPPRLAHHGSRIKITIYEIFTLDL